ncbi:PREDICTED: extracellular serine/threonine protein kinase four-jointed [Nicrophorus vespilloides]|uniref:Extracellular serine/threonine protein kinase four-jointed n=1 Tax=Nicrophorus vespilloides TaxID=110193 RepID=A0ABM1MIT5_NICVS|nr:PREDICTED: extracellular serine/threonine protein kinase four-jointed [Nicrophorus vespilloides]
MVNYNDLCCERPSKNNNLILPIWDKELLDKGSKKSPNYCLLSVFFAFVVGVSVGVFLPLIHTHSKKPTPIVVVEQSTSSSLILEEGGNGSAYETVSFVDRISRTGASVDGNIYWSESVESSLPAGYGRAAHEQWSGYVRGAVGVKLERGCGRMQNRLVTFQDGTRGCVRYRQNTDQIQGELFSFFLAQLLGIPNLAPSTVSVVDLKTPLWSGLSAEIASAQWATNRPIVLTKFIPDLDSSGIPALFRPLERHLNRNDVLNVSGDARALVELAQWSDLIVFDYLTANLDRVVNNLYNYQWNSNIMEAPAHNLARKLDTDLLVFLDNESGLLHGYRLLDKYEIYHTILLDNLCMFRKQTADAIRTLKRDGNVGDLLRTMFERTSAAPVRDVLPPLPPKSVKILNARIEKVHAQITKCEAIFGDT